MSVKCLVIIAAIVFTSLLGLWGLQLFKLYEVSCTANSVLTFNVEGVLNTEGKVGEELEEKYGRIWDAQDLTFPLAKDELFVATDISINHQKLGPEDVQVPCSESNCTAPKAGTKLKNGFATGNCHLEDSIGTCEIKAWNPIASDPVFSPAGNSLLSLGLKEFIVKLENVIEFPDCDGFPSQVSLDEYTNEDCVYDEKDNPMCPNLRIGDIIKQVRADETLISSSGGILSLAVKWDCDFDDGSARNCRVKYSFEKFHKIGKPVRRQNVHFLEEGSRTLINYIGLRIRLRVEGTFRRINYSGFVFTTIVAIIFLLLIFGGLLAASYFVYKSWLNSNKRTPQTIESGVVTKQNR